MPTPVYSFRQTAATNLKRLRLTLPRRSGALSWMASSRIAEEDFHVSLSGCFGTIDIFHHDVDALAAAAHAFESIMSLGCLVSAEIE